MLSILKLEQTHIFHQLEKHQRILHSIERLAKQGELIPYEIQLREEPAYIVAQLSYPSTLERLVEDGGRSSINWLICCNRFGLPFTFRLGASARFSATRVHA